MTKVTRASIDGRRLRINIPNEIIKHTGISAGDEIIWEVRESKKTGNRILFTYYKKAS